MERRVRVKTRQAVTSVSRSVTCAWSQIAQVTGLSARPVMMARVASRAMEAVEGYDSFHNVGE